MQQGPGRLRSVAALALAALAAAAIAACAAPAAHRERRHHARAHAEKRAEPDRFAVGAIAFAHYCALCHGPNAEGYAADHAPSLRSATFLATASDDYLVRSIREGRPGTAMAAYGRARGGPLDDAEIRAIVTFVREGGPARVALSPAPVSGDASRGEVVYASTCKPCHGTKTDRGEVALQLSNPELLADASDAFLQYAVVHGRPGTPMPSFAGSLSGEQIDDVVVLLRSWARPTPHRNRPEPPPLGPIVLNPNGKAPEFNLRQDRFVPIADVKRALDEKRRMVIIDARAGSDYLASHVPGAISVPYYAFERLDEMPKDGTWILAYCACPHHASGAVVDELRKRGYPRTAILDEGILVWLKRGYPSQHGAPE
ncbi:MAG TPA: c-type cytochrome [Minicystis sp.]|nr:c-type cytochrome [Minicystis sp.]